MVDTSEVDDFAMKGAFSVAKETTMWTPPISVKYHSHLVPPYITGSVVKSRRLR